MFWTDVYPGGPKIEGAWMSAENRVVIVNSRLSNPTGLTIDYAMGDRLFWCDSKLNIIESANADGTNRVIIMATGVYSASFIVNLTYFVLIIQRVATASGLYQATL